MKKFNYQKHILLVGLISTFSVFVNAQTSSDNYVKTKIMLDPSANKYIETTQYVDGLGRPTQLNQKKQGGDAQSDIVSMTEYDDLGHEWKQWIPTPIINEGNYVTDKSKFINQADNAPYQLIEYDGTPLNRITALYEAGEDWHKNHRAVRKAYLNNIDNSSSDLNCVQFNVINEIIQHNGNYTTNQLYITKTTDEDEHVSYEFKDKQGTILLTRQIDNNIKHDTYYVYDDLGNLRYVLPPELSAKASLSADDLKKYAYIYQYDEHHCCITKQLPGEVCIYYIYDNANRIRMTQDSNQQEKGEWIYYKYDIYGRNILKGIYKKNISYKDMCALINTNSTLVESFDIVSTDFYTCHSFPTEQTQMKTLLANYYDNYNYIFLGKASLPSIFVDSTAYTPNVSDAEYYSAKTLLTGSKVAILDNSNEYLWSCIRYDKNARPIQKIEMNVLNGLEKEYTKYSFTGKPIQRILEHTSISKNSYIKEKYCYEYDHADRIINTYYQFNNDPEVLMSKMSYDNLGRLNSKQLHQENSSNFIEKIDYTYNIRNWLTGINSKYFKENLYYNTPITNGSATYYNGNISAQTTFCPNNNILCGYKFTYDGLSRLINGSYGEGAALTSNIDRFSESVSYDLNGNIKNHTNNGEIGEECYGVSQQIDIDLDGNRLKKITNKVPSCNAYGTLMFQDKSNDIIEYYYDKNGNLIKDANKGVRKIEYNYLNLPQYVEMNNSQYIRYIYDANGRKLKQERIILRSLVDVPMGSIQTLDASQIVSYSTVYYCNNNIFIKFNEKQGVELQQIFTSEGYLYKYDAKTWMHYYQLKDHLGNIRAEFNKYQLDYNTNYYPFGMEFSLAWGEYLSSDFRYNSKELQTTHGFNLYDYGKRFYDMTIGIWSSVDPLCEKFYSISPYAYCHNNPVNRIDPDGMADYFGYDGKYYGNDGAKNDDVRVITQDNWDKMQTTDDKGNITYNTDYKTNQSVAFSQAQGISEDATLDVYQHYNPTDLSLRANVSENGSGGGAFWYKRDGSAEGIEINIQGNKSWGISDHSNEIKNTFVHEKQHYDDYTKFGVKAYIAMSNDQKEQRAVLVSIKDETFSKMRANIQKLKKKYGAKHGLIYPTLPINPLQTIVSQPIKF